MSNQVEETKLNVRLSADQARAEIKSFESTVKSLRKEIRSVKDDPAKVSVKQKELDETLLKIKQLKKSIRDEKLTIIINGEVAGKSLNDLRAAMRLAKKDFGEVVSQEQAAKQAASINLIQKQINHLEAPIRKSQGAFSGLITEMKRMAVIAASAYGLQYLLHTFQDLITSNAKLSNELTDLQRIGNLTEEQVNKLNVSLRKLDTPTTMSGLRNLAKEAARAGIEGVDNITKYTKALDMLVVVLGEELGDASSISSGLGKILNVFDGKITAEELTYLGNAIISLANKGVASGPYIVDFTQRVLSTAKAANFTLGATVGLAAGFEELGLKAESSGTAFQTLIATIGEDVPKAAKIANVPLKEFQALFAKSPQEALIKYAEGLVKNGAAFEDVTRAFKDAGEEGIRVRQTLFTIGQSGEFLRNKIDLGNKAMKETTAITAGFALKNDNFASIIDKIGKAFNRLYVNGPLLQGMKSMAVSLYNLIKPTQDLTGESSRLIQANRDQITIANKLLGQYQLLNRDGVIPTAAEKAKLKSITLQLKDVLGESVVSINKETGALTLNIAAVKEAIRQKLLLNNNEAASLALRADNIAQEKSDLIVIGKQQVDELHTRQEILKNLGLTEQKAEALYNIMLGGSAKYKAALQSEGAERIEAISKYFAIIRDLTVTNDKIAAKDKERLEIIKALSKLGFNEKDVNKLFRAETPGGQAPVQLESTGNGSDNGSTEASSLRTRNKELLDYYKERLTTITSYTLQERDFIRQQKQVYATDEQKATGIQLKQAADAAKAEFDIAIAGSEEEVAAREKYRIALNALDTYWNGLEIDAEKAKLQEKSNLRNDAAEKELYSKITEAQINLDYANKDSQAELEAKRQLITARYNLAIKGLEKESSEYVRLTREMYEALSALDQNYYDKKVAQTARLIQVGINLYTSYSQWLDQSDNQRLAKDKRTHDKLVKQYQKALDEKRISNEEFNAKVASADEAYNKRAWELGKKQFNRNKAAGAAQVIVDTVMATMEASHATGNYYVDAGLAFATASAGALQLAKILSAEYPEYKKGGYLVGPSHEQGGIELRDRKTQQPFAYAEGGEVILSKEFVGNNPEFTKLAVASSQAGGSKINFTNSATAPLVNTTSILKTVSIKYVTDSTSETVAFKKGASGNSVSDSTDLNRKNWEDLLLEFKEIKVELQSLKSLPVVFVEKEYQKFKDRMNFIKQKSEV